MPENDERFPSAYTAERFMENAIREVRSTGRDKIASDFAKVAREWSKLVKRMEQIESVG